MGNGEWGKITNFDLFVVRTLVLKNTRTKVLTTNKSFGCQTTNFAIVVRYQ
ncbi:MAG: hypothetical protein DSM106950_02505 [Stigonema ocellatum SAG 48.90 = DSM 106950]|nr:hypothetical protein [Stigonema ocellatum SAG 48.90 = DSM 106950]